MIEMVMRLTGEILMIACFTSIFLSVVIECYYIWATWGGWYKHMPLQVKRNLIKKFRAHHHSH